MKTPGWHDDAYLDWIRQLPCAVHSPRAIFHPWQFQDGIYKSQPDHLPVPGLKAMGMKTPDAFTWPACQDDHRIRERFFSNCGRIYTFDEVRELGMPIRWGEVSLYEIAARLMWAFAWQGPAMGLVPQRIKRSVAAR